uniref:Uncharacterized protein n=1 Tax=Ciona savignyi TaxID=51511 RepID=H2YUN9_CIOSA
MSNKVIKAALKAAKGAIQKKDYDEALDQSKIVLGEDSRNYNALVFVGVCNAEFGKYEDSAIAYQDAIKVGPDQPLAYQGLINLYTKHKKDKLSENENSKLVSAYKGLILLTESSATDSKALELFTGLASALCALNQYADALEPMETLYKKLKAEEFDANCKYTEAISAYNTMQQPNHKDLCMLALALHSAGNLKDSLTNLEKAKALSTEQKELDQIKIAQAIILTKLRKVEEAKKMLKEVENSREALQ